MIAPIGPADVVAVVLLLVIVFIKYIKGEHDPVFPIAAGLIVLGVRFPEFGWFMLRVALVALAEAE